MDKKEARRLFRIALEEALRPFSQKPDYGLELFVPEVMTQIIKAAEQLHQNLLEEEE